MLTRTTRTFATHEVPLECDVYNGDECPPESPVLLFFHSGGLVGGSRACVPPWLIQACLQRRWPLISASYRLLPQAGGEGLLADAAAAYKFARFFGPSDTGGRQVVVVGASAGFLMAVLIAHHLQPPPAALLSITGITTFRHQFFNTSVLLTPKPITDDQIQHHILAPVSVGQPEPGDATVFHLDMILETGSKNPSFQPPAGISADQQADEEVPRGCLYDYYLYNNAYTSVVGEMDPGFEWAKAEAGRTKRDAWPTTIIIQGNADDDVDFQVSVHMVDCLGADKVKLCVADGRGHLFESTNFLEDAAPGMDTVRSALEHLDRDMG